MKFARNVVGTKIKELLVQVNQFSFWNQHSVGVPNPSGGSGLPSNFSLFQFTCKAQQTSGKNLHFKKLFEEQA